VEDHEQPGVTRSERITLDGHAYFIDSLEPGVGLLPPVYCSGDAITNGRAQEVMHGGAFEPGTEMLC
jgi:hypothetical protein